MIIATPKIMYFVLGMVALLLCGVHWAYGLPLIGYVAWKQPKSATPFLSGFVLMALYMSPVITVYVHVAFAQWVAFLKAIFGG